MPRSRIAILGTGLIGTSLGLCLSARQGRTYEIVGADRDRGRARTAKKMGGLDRDVGSIEEAVEDAGLVILAVPVVAARHLLKEMAGYLQPGALVTDVCSTKADIIRWAEEFLPETVHFVGGHPMAGKEQSGPEAASADLFKGATWAVIPSPRAGESAVLTVLGMVESTGATPVYYDAAEHDQYVAAVSHLPILLSVALFRMVRDSQAWEDAAMLAGPAFRDLTRLASGQPTMSGDIMATNADAVLHWVERFRDQLDTVADKIRQGGEAMAELFVRTSIERDSFVLNPPVRRRPEGPETPSAQDQMWRLFAGGLYDRYKEILNRPPEVARDDQELKRKLGVSDRDR